MFVISIESDHDPDLSIPVYKTDNSEDAFNAMDLLTTPQFPLMFALRDKNKSLIELIGE